MPKPIRLRVPPSPHRGEVDSDVLEYKKTLKPKPRVEEIEKFEDEINRRIRKFEKPDKKK